MSIVRGIDLFVASSFTSVLRRPCLRRQKMKPGIFVSASLIADLAISLGAYSHVFAARFLHITLQDLDRWRKSPEAYEKETPLGHVEFLKTLGSWHTLIYEVSCVQDMAQARLTIRSLHHRPSHHPLIRASTCASGTP